MCLWSIQLRSCLGLVDASNDDVVVAVVVVAVVAAAAAVAAAVVDSFCFPS